MKYVPVTPELKKAIELTVKELGSNAKLADLVGMSPATIGSYLLGRRHNIKEDQYKKLHPFIKEYLNDCDDPTDQQGGTDLGLSETALNLARFYDSLDAAGQEKIKNLQHKMLMDLYSKTHF